MLMQGFAPQGNTVAVTPNASTANVALPKSAGTDVGYQLRIRNISTNEVFINFGSTNAVTAVVPTPGSPATGIPIAPNSIEILSVPFGTAFVAYIQAVAGSGNMYLTQGEGV